MPSSIRFRDLQRELNRLKKQFLPKFSPTSNYTDRQIALTTAYRVLAHAEIESYIEDRVWEVALYAKQEWDRQKKSNRTLICLLGFSGQMMEVPPITLTPIRGNRVVPPERTDIDKKIDSALNVFRKVIENNHGLKEKNLLALLLPIGIKSNELDSVFLANMDTFGEQRGLVAHSSATSYRTTQLPDPATELDKVQQIIVDLQTLDDLISCLTT